MLLRWMVVVLLYREGNDVLDPGFADHDISFQVTSMVLVEGPMSDTSLRL